jgi:hypothetical protein
MSGASASVKNLRLDAFSVVPNAHSKLSFSIADVDFNAGRAGVVEGVAYGLAGNTIHLVPQNRMQVSRLPFHIHAEGCTILTVLLGSELFSKLG